MCTPYMLSLHVCMRSCVQTRIITSFHTPTHTLTVADIPRALSSKKPVLCGDAAHEWAVSDRRLPSDCLIAYTYSVIVLHKKEMFSPLSSSSSSSSVLLKTSSKRLSFTLNFLTCIGEMLRAASISLSFMDAINAPSTSRSLMVLMHALSLVTEALKK